MALRTVTFAFSLKTIQTILTGQSKALPLETQNIPPTLGQTQIGLAPRKVSSRAVPGPKSYGHFPNHIKNAHTSRTSKRNCQC